jgi:hypothetical protein
MTIEVGMQVTLVNDKGSLYTVYRTEPWKDGTILLYGGDANPNGIRGFRSALPEQIAPAKVRRPKAK